MSLYANLLRDRANQPDRRFSEMLLRSDNPLPGDSQAMAGLLRELGWTADDVYRAESHVMRHATLIGQAQAWRSEIPHIESRLADARHRAKHALEVDEKTYAHPRHVARQQVAEIEMEGMVHLEKIRQKENEARLLRAQHPIIFAAWPGDSA